MSANRRIGSLRLRFSAVAVVALPVIVLTGCVSIKTETTFQRVPGVVSLKVVVCASDYNQSHYTTCNASNVQETDNFRADADDSSPTLGQLLVGFRVQDGSAGPDSFLSDAQDVSLSRSLTYTHELNRLFPPPAGTHWEGYISTPKTFDPSVSATRETGFHPEFTLPAQADGGPFPGPYPWRVVAGFRQLNNAGQAGDPVDCTGFIQFCADSPPNASIPDNLQAPVSDFGVLAGSSVTVGQTATATVAFPVRYIDAGALGSQDLSISATTSLPGSSATPSVTTLHANPNSTTMVNVSVPVPAGTPLGSYAVTLSAADGSPGVTRSNTATIVVVDNIAPNIRISTPTDGATFLRGQAVVADYACTDELNGTRIKSCSGPVAPGAAIDTGSVGTKTFKVDASDNAGNTSTLAKTYTVVLPPPARIVVSLAFNFRATRTSTRFTRLLVSGVPEGSTVTAKCRPKKKGRKCPAKAFTKQNARGTVKLKSFLRKRFTPGTVIEVRVTKPGAIGAVKRLTIRKNKAPLGSSLCLPPSAKNPTKC